MCNTSMCYPIFSEPRPPCGYLNDVRQEMCNPYEYTLVHVHYPSHIATAQQECYCLRTSTMETITASDMLLQQRQPPTGLVPSHSRKLVG